MSRRDRTESAKAGDVLQFTLVGLVIFSVALIAAAAFIGYKLAAITRPKPSDFFTVNPNDKRRSVYERPMGHFDGTQNPTGMARGIRDGGCVKPAEAGSLDF